MAEGSSWWFFFGGGLWAPRGSAPKCFLNFTPSRRQETASPVLKTDSVDTVFTFYYARKMQPATLNRTFRAVLHIQRPFSFIFFILLFSILFSGRLSLETQYKIEFLVPGNGLRRPLEKTLNIHMS